MNNPYQIDLSDLERKLYTSKGGILSRLVEVDKKRARPYIAGMVIDKKGESKLKLVLPFFWPPHKL
jgi:hypothetical protein